eukprot:6593562-Pyramimonas_sp.AAC.1
MPRNGVLGTRRPRSGLQLAPGVQNVAREWSSGTSKTTTCVTVCFKRLPRILPGTRPASAKTPLGRHEPTRDVSVFAVT